jgi:hypothetical protein
MTNRFNAVACKLTHPMATKPSTTFKMTGSARTVLAAAQHALTILGLSAIFMAVVLFLRPDYAKAVSQMIHPEEEAAVVQAPSLADLMAPQGYDAAAEAEPEPMSADEKALLGSKKQQEYVTSWLAKRYRVADEATNMLVSTAYLTAREVKIDPLLILAVMAIESGLNPFAESAMGAQGLMQVMSKVHRDKFQEMGGIQAALNPVANIRVGALILKDYVNRGGSVEAGLKTYVGAAAFATDSGYGHKVMNEWQKLKLVASGKRVPVTNPPPAAAPASPAVVPAPAQQVVEKEAPGEQIAGL